MCSLASEVGDLSARPRDLNLQGRMVVVSRQGRAPWQPRKIVQLPRRLNDDPQSGQMKGSCRGTFEGEREDDKVVYGLVHPLNSWDPIYTQLCHWRYIAETVWRFPGLTNKIAVFVKGPGWEPGKPRLGETSDIPDVHSPVLKYDKTCWTAWISIYTWLHIITALVVYEMVADCSQGVSYLHLSLGALFIFWTVTSLGHLHECRKWAPYVELLRCVTYLMVDYHIRHTDDVRVTRDTWVTSDTGSTMCDTLWLVHLFSGAVWLIR